MHWGRSGCDSRLMTKILITTICFLLNIKTLAINLATVIAISWPPVLMFFLFTVRSPQSHTCLLQLECLVTSFCATDPSALGVAFYFILFLL